MYGLRQPSAYEAVESFSYRNWFKDVYHYAISQTRVVTKTSAYTVESNVFMVRVDTTSAGVTITLPTAAQTMGRQIVVKKIDAGGNTVTVATTGSETIDGASTKTTSTQWTSFTFISNGSNWEII